MLDGRVLITGGAGFLARGIYRRARAEKWDCRFACLSRDDAKHARLQARYPEVDCYRGDVAGDIDYLVALMAGFDYVIHAAAAKYVDRSEFAAWDTIRTNIVGSQHVIVAARAAGVRHVVGISTDKAVQPANIYGGSKFAMERLFLEADQWESPTTYSICRYGNVIASTGSVIPLFREQARAGSITLTDPRHTRFWMGVNQAIDAIVEATQAPGLIVVPQPQAMGMSGLAKAIWAMERPDEEPQIVTIGERPGEKAHEVLVSEEESTRIGEWHQTGYNYIERPGITFRAQKRWQLCSRRPDAGWMDYGVMQELARDAEGI